MRFFRGKMRHRASDEAGSRDRSLVPVRVCSYCNRATGIESLPRKGDLGILTMTTIAMGTSNYLGVELMRLMHEFRHDIFVKRLGWSLPLVAGVERDEYDTEEAAYLVVRDESDRVTACARLLPTLGRYMLPELFPQLLGGRPEPRSAAVWELSRFAANVRETGEGRVLSLSKPTLDLLEQVFGFAREKHISRLLLVTSVSIERLMLRAGVAAHRISHPATVDGKLCVALFIEVPPVAACDACGAAAPRALAEGACQ
jgi:N-acyl-L-homoserine lactone synthetase